ncbi:hypothetical protein B0H13DRAFT_1925267 [Mycena leptocephala]|nr:hypothetical protein B0H13DRAFT_1925267 [Mycena leptocephala]
MGDLAASVAASILLPPQVLVLSSLQLRSVLLQWCLKRVERPAVGRENQLIFLHIWLATTVYTIASVAPRARFSQMNRGVSLSGVLGHIPFALLATRPQGTDTDGFKVRSSGAALLAGCTAHSLKLQTCHRREFALCYVCGCYAVFESTGAALHPTPVYCCTQLYLLARCRDSARVQATRGQAMQYTGAAVLFELYPCANGVTGRPGDVETRSPLRKIVPQAKPAAPVADDVDGAGDFGTKCHHAAQPPHSREGPDYAPLRRPPVRFHHRTIPHSTAARDASRAYTPHARTCTHHGGEFPRVRRMQRTRSAGGGGGSGPLPPHAMVACGTGSWCSGHTMSALFRLYAAQQWSQCQRRALKCEYPSKSRRGMRKRKVPEREGGVGVYLDGGTSVDLYCDDNDCEWEWDGHYGHYGNELFRAEFIWGHIISTKNGQGLLLSDDKQSPALPFLNSTDCYGFALLLWEYDEEEVEIDTTLFSGIDEVFNL